MAGAAILVVPAFLLAAPDRGPQTTARGDATSTGPPGASATHPAEPPGGEPAETVLVFDDGRDGAVTVDFESGVLERTRLPGQRAGQRPFRLWRLEERLVVGADRIWAVQLDADASQQLGEATTFLPDARPDRLWLIDDPGVGSGHPTWTLIDGSGDVLHRTVGRDGMVPVRGVPSGLALTTRHGLKVYDVASDRIYFYVGAPHGRIGDVAADRVVWCRPGCHRLAVVSEGPDRTTLGADEVMAFETGSVWLSPDGRHLAAVASAVAPGTVPVRQVMVFEVDAGRVHARQRVPSGDLHGSWSVDGRQFFYALPDGDRLELGRFRVGGTGFEVRAHPRPVALDGFVALPRTAAAG